MSAPNTNKHQKNVLDKKRHHNEMVAEQEDQDDEEEDQEDDHVDADDEGGHQNDDEDEEEDQNDDEDEEDDEDDENFYVDMDFTGCTHKQAEREWDADLTTDQKNYFRSILARPSTDRTRQRVQAAQKLYQRHKGLKFIDCYNFLEVVRVCDDSDSTFYQHLILIFSPFTSSDRR